MTQDELDALTVEWQQRLGLADWDVKVSIERARDMRADSQGCVHWTMAKKQASIHILDPLDYSSDCAWPQDQERTLVHELLHLHFAPFAVPNDEDGSLKDLAQEQAIEALACALVKLKREAERLRPVLQPVQYVFKDDSGAETGPYVIDEAGKLQNAEIFHTYNPACGCSACRKAILSIVDDPDAWTPSPLSHPLRANGDRPLWDPAHCHHPNYRGGRCTHCGTEQEIVAQ